MTATTKICSKCGDAKPLEAFHKRTRSKDGREARCKSCRTAWYALNKERAAATGAAWRAANKGRKAATTAAWIKANPEKRRAAKAKRRAAKLKRTPAWADLEAIAAIYAACPNGYQVDHIIPLQGRKVSGFHVTENLQYLTKSENASKRNKFKSKDHRYVHPALAKILRLKN